MLAIPGYKEPQIKTTLRFCLTLVRIITIRNINSNKFWQGCGEKRNPHTLLVAMQAYTTTLENNMES
jgi:hypothetical protein